MHLPGEEVEVEEDRLHPEAEAGAAEEAAPALYLE